MEKPLKAVANINIVIGMIMLVSPVVFVLYYIFFGIPQKVEAQYDPNKESEIIVQPIFTDEKLDDPFGNIDSSSLVPPLSFVVPENEVLDIGTKIRIPTIGLDTKVYETKNPNKGLDAGVWRDPLYGSPDKPNSGPVVLAAHRWGEDWFSWEYRYANLFTKFEQLKPGQEVIVTWNNQEYRYIIRAVDQNTSVTQSADLIMYTCVYYNSPERIFIYADLSD